MKNIYKPLVLLTLVAGLASCNNVAEFQTEAFVAFSGTSFTVKENAGEIKIPVNLVSSNPLTTTVSYQITGGDAVVDKHYTMPNTSGVITVSTDPAKCDSIVVCPIDSTGVFTKNKTLEFTILSVTEEGVQLSNTDKCKLTIIDIDGGLNLLVGHWAGSGLKTNGSSGAIEFDLALCDEGESEDFPNANVMIPKGGLAIKDPSGNDWKSQLDLFLYFDDNKSELQLYPEQIFDAGNFGDPYGVLYISLDIKNTLLGVDIQPVVFKVNDEVLTLADDVYCGLWNDSGFAGITCGAFLANGEIRKQ